MRRLVAIDLPADSTFVEVLRRIWDGGDVALPLDQRVDLETRRRIASTCGAHAVIDLSGVSELEGGEPMSDGDALVIPTSGTTGTPKAAVLTHSAVRASAIASNESLGTSTTSCWIACLPLSHVGGLSVITRALQADCRLRVLPRFEAKIVERIARENDTFVSLVPALLPRVDPTLFRGILLGGGRPPADRPPNSVATYGLTETGSGVVHDGRPLRDVELRVVDGEILVRSPMNMRGYRDGSTLIDDDGWLHTGDEGSLAADGLLTVAGRRGDCVNTGGEKVWPDTVESVLARWKPDAGFCVVGVPDEVWGQRLVLVTDRRDITLPDVVDVVRGSLPPWCAPKEVVVVDELPRTAIGKIRRGAVAALAADLSGPTADRATPPRLL